MFTISFKTMKFEKKKPLIYSKSLTWCKTVCPWCGLENPDSEDMRSELYSRENVGLPLEICPNCRNVYDMENMVIKMSKDYAECKALGLKGAVTKDKKGKWVQV